MESLAPDAGATTTFDECAHWMRLTHNLSSSMPPSIRYAHPANGSAFRGGEALKACRSPKRMVEQEDRRDRVRWLRRRLWLVMVAAVIGFVLGVFVQQLPQRQWAALGAVLAGASVAVLLGGFGAWFAAGSYLDDRQTASRFGSLWGYVSRAGTWGLAGGGIGALLATALPSRLAEAPSSPHEIPIAGWLAIFFGSAGIAVGILEQWRSTDGPESSE